jgi:5-methyltetrahydropteroyltriglutamate--homocysteine methyltransferase
MTRILTTHVGSLPRSQIVADLLFAREKGLPVDVKAYDKVMVEATAVILKKPTARRRRSATPPTSRTG